MRLHGRLRKGKWIIVIIVFDQARRDSNSMITGVITLVKWTGNLKLVVVAYGKDQTMTYGLAYLKMTVDMVVSLSTGK